jgi:hypothetical protein
MIALRAFSILARGIPRSFSRRWTRIHQPLQIEEMLGAVLGLGPAGSRIELDAGKITDLAVYAIADDSGKFLLPGGPPDHHAQWYGGFQLEACSGRRDIFEDCLRLPGCTGGISPGHLHQVCAHHPNLRSPLGHKPLIGVAAPKLYYPALPLH